MKFIFLTDSHIRGKNPINRVGDFRKHIFDKHREVVELSKELGCDFVLHGGDLFDSPLVALSLCDELVDMVEESGIPWHVVQGNHDELFRETSLSSNSMLSHIFKRSKLVNHLGSNPIDTESGYIQGFDYCYDIEGKLKVDGLMCSKPNHSGKKIALVHAYLVEKSVPFEHILINELKTDFDLVLIGHYHSQIGPLRNGNTTFLCPGSMSRLTVSKGDTTRKVQVVFIDTEKPRMSLIPLKSMRPAEDVFDLGKVSEVKEYKRDVDEFINSLESTKFQSFNLANVIIEIGRKNDVGTDVMDEIMERIGRAEDAVKF